MSSSIYRSDIKPPPLVDETKRRYDKLMQDYRSKPRKDEDGKRIQLDSSVLSIISMMYMLKREDSRFIYFADHPPKTVNFFAKCTTKEITQSVSMDWVTYFDDLLRGRNSLHSDWGSFFKGVDITDRRDYFEYHMYSLLNSHEDFNKVLTFAHQFCGKSWSKKWFHNVIPDAYKRVDEAKRKNGYERPTAQPNTVTPRARAEASNKRAKTLSAAAAAAAPVTEEVPEDPAPLDPPAATTPAPTQKLTKQQRRVQANARRRQAAALKRQQALAAKNAVQPSADASEDPPAAPESPTANPSDDPPPAPEPSIAADSPRQSQSESESSAHPDAPSDDEQCSDVRNAGASRTSHTDDKDRYELSDNDASIKLRGSDQSFEDNESHDSSESEEYQLQIKQPKRRKGTAQPRNASLKRSTKTVSQPKKRGKNQRCTVTNEAIAAFAEHVDRHCKGDGPTAVFELTRSSPPKHSKRNDTGPSSPLQSTDPTPPGSPHEFEEELYPHEDDHDSASEEDAVVDEAPVAEIEDIIEDLMPPSELKSTPEMLMYYLKDFEDNFVQPNVRRAVFQRQSKEEKDVTPASKVSKECIQFIQRIERSKQTKTPEVTDYFRRPFGPSGFLLHDAQREHLEQIYHLLTQGPTNRNAVFGAPTSYGKTDCSICAMEKLFDDGLIQACFIITKSPILSQWVEKIHTLARPGASVHCTSEWTAKTTPRVVFEIRKALAAPNPRVYWVIPDYVLGLTSKMQLIYNALTGVSYAIVADEAHTYTRHVESPAAQNLRSLCMPIDLYDTVTYMLLVSATMVIEGKDARKLLSGLLNIPQLPRDPFGSSQNELGAAAKIFSAMHTPSRDDKCTFLEDLKPPCITYKLRVTKPPPLPRKEGDDLNKILTEESLRERMGTGIYWGEYNPILYAVTLATILYQTTKRRSVIFYNNVEGLIELERTMKLAPSRRGPDAAPRYYYVHGQKSLKEREETFKCFRDEPGIMCTTLELLSAGTNLFSETKTVIAFIAGEAVFSKEAKEQIVGRLARRGQDEPVMLLYLVCEGRYSKATQDIVDRKEAGNAASTGKSYVQITGDTDGEDILPLHMAPSAMFGLYALFQKKLVYHFKNLFGVSVDPESKTKPRSPMPSENGGPFIPAHHSRRYADEIQIALRAALNEYDAQLHDDRPAVRRHRVTPAEAQEMPGEELEKDDPPPSSQPDVGANRLQEDGPPPSSQPDVGANRLQDDTAGADGSGLQSVEELLSRAAEVMNHTSTLLPPGGAA